MLTLSFQSASIAIAQIFMMGLVGFWLVRKGIVEDQGLKMLSFISVNIVFPFFIFYQILLHFDPVQMPHWWGFPLINIGLTFAAVSLAFLVFKFSGKIPKDEALAVAGLHNAGYIPLLLAMTLPLGDMAGKVYTGIILSIIGFDLCLWSLGVWLITRASQGHMDLRRMLNPPLISMTSALALVLCFGPNPIGETWMKPIKIMGDAAMPMSMMIIGGNLALTRLNALATKGLWTAAVLKTMVLPGLVLLVLTQVHLDPVIRFIVMVQACMPTSITLSIIGRKEGTANQDFVNSCIFVTHLICLITLPLFLGLYGAWIKP